MVQCINRRQFVSKMPRGKGFVKRMFKNLKYVSRKRLYRRPGGKYLSYY